MRRSGHDVSVIASGRSIITAQETEKILNQNGVSADIVELPTVYPLNKAEIIRTAMKTGFVVTIEDNVKSGGMGEHIALMLAESDTRVKFKAFGYPDQPIVQGTVKELDKLYKTDAETIAEYIIRNRDNGKNKA